jgi:hypothetical protein
VKLAGRRGLVITLLIEVLSQKSFIQCLTPQRVATPREASCGLDIDMGCNKYKMLSLKMWLISG